MNPLIRIALAGALAASLSLPAMAQSAPAMMGMMGMGGATSGPQGTPRDCSKAPHPETCKARQATREKAQAACADKQGAERRQCMQAQRPPVDCSQHQNPQRCEQRQAKQAACEGKSGPERRRCMQQNPGPAPTK